MRNVHSQILPASKSLMSSSDFSTSTEQLSTRFWAISSKKIWSRRRRAVCCSSCRLEHSSGWYLYLNLKDTAVFCYKSCKTNNSRQFRPITKLSWSFSQIEKKKIWNNKDIQIWLFLLAFLYISHSNSHWRFFLLFFLNLNKSNIILINSYHS